jgi:hypothetical protein
VLDVLRYIYRWRFQPVLYPGRRKSLLSTAFCTANESSALPSKSGVCARIRPLSPPAQLSALQSACDDYQLQLLPFPGDAGFLAIHSCIPAPSLTFVRRTRLRESAVVRQLTPILQISIFIHRGLSSVDSSNDRNSMSSFLPPPGLLANRSTNATARSVPGKCACSMRKKNLSA